MDLFIGKNHIGNAAVKSIFRLVGHNEDALTYALGYLLAYDDSFCDKVVRHFVRAVTKEGQPNGKRPKVFRGKYSIHLQELSDKTLGRRDIVIKAGGKELIVEAKIGGGQPSSAQVLQYVLDNRGRSRTDVWGVVALTQADMPVQRLSEIKSEFLTKAFGKGFAAIQWHEVVAIAAQHRFRVDDIVVRYLVGEFIRFIRREMEMHYHDSEIAVQDVDKKNEGIFMNGWIYAASSKAKKAPIYFAPYFTEECDKPGIYMLSRVVDDITVPMGNPNFTFDEPDDHLCKKWNHGLQLIRELRGGESWAQNDARILCLSEPIILTDYPITKKDLGVSRQIPPGYSLQFDVLLRHLGEKNQAKA